MGAQEARQGDHTAYPAAIPGRGGQAFRGEGELQTLNAAFSSKWSQRMEVLLALVNGLLAAAAIVLGALIVQRTGAGLRDAEVREQFAGGMFLAAGGVTL